jgi:hypothetical protein
VFPDAPNRRAVLYNLATWANNLDGALVRMKKSPSHSRTPFESRDDVMSFNIDHFCRPNCLYTNCQAVVSIVARDPNRFEGVYHSCLSSFLRFNSGLPEALIEPEHVWTAQSPEEAETIAAEQLSTIRTQTLRMHKDEQVDKLVLQPAGSRSDEHHYPLHTSIATFRDNKFRVQMGGPPFGRYEPYRVLNELRPEEYVVQACATCASFRFSGMARDMSAGSRGYCFHKGNRASTNERLPIVSVTHYCDAYRLIEDKDRHPPYICSA